MKWTLLLVCRTLCHTDQSAVKQWSVRHHNDVYWQYETWLLFYDFSRFHSPNSFWINVLCMRICFRIVFVFFFFLEKWKSLYMYFSFLYTWTWLPTVKQYVVSYREICYFTLIYNVVISLSYPLFRFDEWTVGIRVSKVSA